MSLLVGYDSGSSDEEQIPVENSNALKINPTPVTSDLLTTDISFITNNSNKQQLATLNASKIRKTTTGYIQEESHDHLKFKNKKRLYDKYSEDEINNTNNNELFSALRSKRSDSNIIKKQRKQKGDPSKLEGEDEYKGPWASYGESSDNEYVSSGDDQDVPIEPWTDYEESDEESKPEITIKDEETTELFGSGKYMTIPKDVKTKLTKTPGSQICYVPKKKIHTFEGHLKGTQHLQFLPGSGHLLLSCGNDSKIKLWDVYHKRELLRVYNGHTRAVKYVQFNRKGDKFISCSYDRYVKIWNTETGKCSFKLRLKSIPNVVKFNPNNENEFLVCLTNRRIEHYDTITNEIVQTYDHHMDSVTYLEFINDNQSFVTSSADKTLRIWNLKINMPMKQIAAPKQHSMPFLRLHPSGKHYVAQSMDNTILTFYARSSEEFKKNTKKSFSGHNSSGHSIELQFTPDGKNLISGDSYGFIYCWDWNKGRLVSKLKVDKKVISCVDCHPQEASTVVCSGLSGHIFMYD